MEQEEQTDFKPKSLDDLLDKPPEPDKAEEPAKAEEAKGETAAPEPDKEPDKAEAGDHEPPDKPEEDAPPASEKTVPLPALIAVRKKLQASDGKIEELTQEVERLKAPQRPDPEDDPQGAAEFDRKRAEQRDAQAQEREFNLLVKLDKRNMQRLHDDYDDVEAIFVEEAMTNQALAVQFTQSEFPAEFAYTEGKRLEQVKAMGENPQGYIDSIVEKRVAEALEKAGKTPPANVPESLAEAPSASREDVQKWDGPKPLDKIING